MDGNDELRRHSFREADAYEVFVTGDPVDVRATMRSFEYSGEIVTVTTPAYRGTGLTFHSVLARLVRGVTPRLRNIVPRTMSVGAVRWCPVHILSEIDGGLVRAYVVGPLGEMQRISIDAGMLR